MKYRIIEVECSDNKQQWTVYIPQYKNWYNIFWQKWKDPISGIHTTYNSYTNAKNFIDDQKCINSFKQSIKNIYNQ